MEKDDDVKDGDMIVTSNISGKFLPGILIGYATDITRVLYFGKNPKPIYKKMYTYVLKAFLTCFLIPLPLKHLPNRDFFSELSYISAFSPDKLVNNACIAFDDFNHLGRNVFLYVIGYGNAVIAVTCQLHRRFHRLQKMLFINACKHEATLVQCFGTLG